MWEHAYFNLLVRRLCKSQTPLFQRYPLSLADDEMIEDFHVQQLPGLDDRPRHRDIVGAGGWVPGGMVVDHDQGRGILSHRFPEYFTDSDL